MKPKSSHKRGYAKLKKKDAVILRLDPKEELSIGLKKISQKLSCPKTSVVKIALSEYIIKFLNKEK